MINYKMTVKQIIEELKGGVWLKPERFKGDDHACSGGPVDIEGTDELMGQAAEIIEDLKYDIDDLNSQLASEQSHSSELERAINNLQTMLAKAYED
jgi:hypothetical protein